MEYKVSFVLFLVTIFLEGVSSECNVFINELNIVDPKKPEKSEFIELKTNCENLPLRGYKIIGISAGNKKNPKPSIILVATLWNEKFKGELYTIGGINVAKSDLNITSGNVKFRDSWNKNQQLSMTNFLVNGNRNLYAIGILFKRNDAMSSIQLEKNKNTILINDSLIEYLKVYLVDLVVYSEKHDSDRCNIFEELHAPFAQKKYAIREFSFKDGKDLSLNRCTVETEGFIPEKFKLGNPTPGSDNDCSGSHFIFEDRIQEILPSVITSVDIENSDAHNVEIMDDSCTTSIRHADYYLATQQSIENYITNANIETERDGCTLQQLYPDSGNLAEEVDNANRRKRHLSIETDYSEELEWETQKYFEYVFI